MVLDSPNLRPFTSLDSSAVSTPTIEMSQSAFDPDSMDMDMDMDMDLESSPSSTSSTPPSTPPHELHSATHPVSVSSAFDNIRASRNIKSGYSTPRGVSPHPSIPGIDTSASMLAGGRGEAALFNPYASYADFSALMPGTVRTPIHQSPTQTSASAGNATNANGSSATRSGNGSPSAASAVTQCIPPALLFAPSASNTPLGTPSHSRTGTPVPNGNSGNLSRTGSISGTPASGGLPKTASPAALMSTASDQSKASSSSSSHSGIKKSHSLGSGGGSINPLLASGSSSSTSGSTGPVSKPFKCPTVGCNKSYKQANGLKYHITHGQCNFMPRDPALEGLNESEADEKSRPYVCQVGNCTRRYKNMNGLRELPFPSR